MVGKTKGLSRREVLQQGGATLALMTAAKAAFPSGALAQGAGPETKAAKLGFIALALAFFAKFEGMFSRVWLAGTYMVGFVALIGLRLVLVGVVRHWTSAGRLDRRAVVVGGGDAGETLIEAIKAQKDSDVHVVGVFDDRGDERSPTTLAGRTKLGTVDDLVEFARRTRVDLVIFSLPISAEVRILQMLKKLWVLPVDIRLAAHSKLRWPWRYGSRCSRARLRYQLCFHRVTGTCTKCCSVMWPPC